MDRPVGRRHTGRIDRLLTPATSLDLFARRTEWQLATLLVALVVVPGALDAYEQSNVASTPRRASDTTPRRHGHPATRTIRPPRSC
ncbi:MAG: hypothetical protein S0880_28740 [Actinomycetota bacterium]|nr:hypothetical protein [Actinomycetota bacterium]